MGKITEYIETVKQHHHATRLRVSSVKKYADDPDVVFHNTPPERRDAPHGANTQEDMAKSADPVTD